MLLFLEWIMNKLNPPINVDDELERLRKEKGR